MYQRIMLTSARVPSQSQQIDQHQLCLRLSIIKQLPITIEQDQS